MKKSTDDTPVGCALITGALLLSVLVGMVLNIYKLCKLDFKEPYRAEVVRLVGVFTPIGPVIGYINFEEESR